MVTEVGTIALPQEYKHVDILSGGWPYGIDTKEAAAAQHSEPPCVGVVYKGNILNLAPTPIYIIRVVVWIGVVDLHICSAD